MDAKYERVHFLVRNMVTKLVGDKHKRWPDLLGTVTPAYNATIHSATWYSPHELFYLFATACPLDGMVTVLGIRSETHQPKTQRICIRLARNSLTWGSLVVLGMK